MATPERHSPLEALAPALAPAPAPAPAPALVVLMPSRFMTASDRGPTRAPAAPSGAGGPFVSL